jgi:hypothetical protein
MWLFTGRYAQYGPAICVIALGVLSIGVIFLVIAVRLVQRRDVACVLITAIVAAAFSESQAFGEPVFVSNNFNHGTALFLAIVGILLGIGGVVLLNKLRLLRILILVAASATLFGDLAGWIRRSAGPSKYDVGASESSAPLWRKSGFPESTPPNRTRRRVVFQKADSLAGAFTCTSWETGQVDAAPCGVNRELFSGSIH